MKKLMGLLFAGVALFALSGCGSGSDNPPANTHDVNYLTDDFGDGIAGVVYDCNTYSGTTDGDGAFDFDPTGDDCEFDLDGIVEDLYIMNETDGVNGLDYDCLPSGISGVTGDHIDDGGFDYDVDDICIISY